jgi:hypothetical protein
VSVATGIAPSELVELDGLMFDALVEAVAERWGPELELAALQVELESSLLIAYAQAHSRKRITATPTVWPRPAWVREGREPELEPAAAARVGIAELAALAGKVVEPVEGPPSG